jgi:hypothetical protein
MLPPVSGDVVHSHEGSDMSPPAPRHRCNHPRAGITFITVITSTPSHMMTGSSRTPRPASLRCNPSSFHHVMVGQRRRCMLCWAMVASLVA